MLGFVVVLMVVIPLTVYLVQQQQKLKVTAEKATTLSFAPQTFTFSKSTDEAKFDISLDPGGKNLVSFVKLAISYDATKLKVKDNSFTANSTSFPSVLSPADPGNGKATITLSVGSNPNSIVQSVTKVASITFILQPGATAGETQIKLLPDPETQVLSIGTGDQFNENVWTGSASPATLTISPGATGAIPANQLPVCSSSTVDKATTGTAPYAINLQAQGTDSDGTITKVTYNWGDTQSQDFTTGFGIGTNSVDIKQNHTYTNGGTFNAVVTFTDDKGGTSVAVNCTKTFTINGPTASPTPTPAGSTGGGGTAGGAGGSTGGTGTTQIVTVATPAPTAAPEIAPLPGTKGGLPAPGPGDNIVKFGGLGVLSIIIGALLLFGL